MAEASCVALSGVCVVAFAAPAWAADSSASVDSVIAAQQQLVTTNSGLPFASTESKALLPEFAQNLAYYQLNILLSQQNAATSNQYMPSNPNQLSSVGVDPQQTLALANPDTVYLQPFVDPNGTYVITVAPGAGTEDLTFTAAAGFGVNNQSGIKVLPNPLRLADLEPNADGTYTIIVSPDPQSGNWLDSSGATSLLIRDTLGNWAEDPSDVTIQRTDTATATPTISQIKSGAVSGYTPLSSADVDALLQTIATSMPQANAINNAVLNQILASSAPNTVGNISDASANVPGQLAGTASAFGRYQLAPGEALIVRVPAVEGLYGGIELTDTWGQSLPSQYKQTSLNNTQAVPDADGYITYVISDTDPGVPNWLDSSDAAEGGIYIRFQGVTGDGPTTSVVQTQVVPVSEVRDYLPADTPTITEAERAQQLKLRAASFQNVLSASKNTGWVILNLQTDDIKAAIGDAAYAEIFGTPVGLSLAQRLDPANSPDLLAAAQAILNNPIGSFNSIVDELPQIGNEVALPTVLAVARFAKVVSSLAVDLNADVASGQLVHIPETMLAAGQDLSSVMVKTVSDRDTSITAGLLNARDDVAFALSTADGADRTLDADRVWKSLKLTGSKLDDAASLAGDLVVQQAAIAASESTSVSTTARTTSPAADMVKMASAATDTGAVKSAEDGTGTAAQPVSAETSSETATDSKVDATGRFKRFSGTKHPTGKRSNSITSTDSTDRDSTGGSTGSATSDASAAGVSASGRRSSDDASASAGNKRHDRSSRKEAQHAGAGK